MNKRKTRCYLAYCDAGGIFNNEVYYPVSDGYRIELATCIACGALFVINRENPRTLNREIKAIASALPCPECGCELSQSIRDYPKFFLGKGGYVGSFTPTSPSFAESFVRDFWDLTPN